MTEVVSDDNWAEAFIDGLERERERMKYEENRLDSFDSWRLEKYQLYVSVAQRLAKAGFYRWRLDYTKCFSCELRKLPSFWEKGHDPETVHREESPNCKFITGQSFNVSIDVKKQKKTALINQPSLPGMSEPDKPLENEVPKSKPLGHEIQHRTIIDTGPSKSQMQPESKKNEKFTKTNQNRSTAQRTVSSEEAEERISRSKRPAPERPEVIPSTSSLPDVPFTSSGKHAVQNVYQRSAAVTWSSFLAVMREKLSNRRHDRAGISTTHQKLEKKGVSRSNRNGARTDKRENTVLTSSDHSDVGRVKPDTTRLKHFTSDITCSTVSSKKAFRSSVNSLIHIASLKDLFLSG